MIKKHTKKLAYILVIAMMFALAAPLAVNAATGDVADAKAAIDLKSDWAVSVDFDTDLATTLAAIETEIKDAVETELDTLLTSDLAVTVTADDSTDFDAVTNAGDIVTADFVVAIADSAVLPSGDEDDTATISVVVTINAEPAAGTGTNPSGSFEGENEFDEVIFQVEVPTDIGFALNPFQIDPSNVDFINELGQVSSANHTVENSTPEVAIHVALNMTLDTSVTLVNSKTAVKPNDFTATDKKMYFTVISADSTSTVGTYEYDRAKTTTEVPFSVSDKKASISFVLAKFNTALAKANVASFAFAGDLNTYAAWAANDVKVSGTYKITALLPATYDNYVATDVDATSLNMLKSTSSTSPTFVAGGTKNMTLSKGALGTTTAITITLDDTPTALTSVTIDGTAVSAAQRSLTAGVLSFRNNATDAIGLLTAGGGTSAGVYTIVITADDTKVYTIKLTVTA